MKTEKDKFRSFMDINQVPWLFLIRTANLKIKLPLGVVKQSTEKAYFVEILTLSMNTIELDDDTRGPHKNSVNVKV